MRKALNIPLEEFLRPFFGPGERICLRIFDDRKTGTFKGAKLETTLSGLPGLIDTLKKHNEKNRGIYFVVNFGGHEDSEITRINAQFMECDELPLDEQLKPVSYTHLDVYKRQLERNQGGNGRGGLPPLRADGRK